MHYSQCPNFHGEHICIPLLVAGTAHGTPKQVVTRYNNYEAICVGLDYEKSGCKGLEYILIFF